MTAALRTVLRGPLWLTALFLASFALTYAVWPRPVRYTGQATDPLSVMYAEHDCSPPDRPQPDLGHGWQLARRADGTVELLPPGTSGTAWRAGDAFAGWCTP